MAGGSDAVGCVRWRNRRCTPVADSAPTRTADPLGAARPVDAASGRVALSPRRVAHPRRRSRLVDSQSVSSWAVAPATRRAPRTLRRRQRLLGQRRRRRASSCCDRTADPSSAGPLEPPPCVPSSSGGGARPMARTRRSRVSCRSDRDRGRSPAGSAVTAPSRRPPCPWCGATARGLAFGNPDTHPSWSRVSLLSAEAATKRAVRDRASTGCTTVAR